MPATKTSLKKQTKKKMKEKNHKQVMNVDRGEGTHMQQHSMEETEHVEWTHSVLSFVCAHLRDKVKWKSA